MGMVQSCTVHSMVHSTVSRVGRSWREQDHYHGDAHDPGFVVVRVVCAAKQWMER